MAAVRRTQALSLVFLTSRLMPGTNTHFNVQKQILDRKVSFKKFCFSKTFFKKVNVSLQLPCYLIYCANRVNRTREAATWRSIVIVFPLVLFSILIPSFSPLLNHTSWQRKGEDKKNIFFKIKRNLDFVLFTFILQATTLASRIV